MNEELESIMRFVTETEQVERKILVGPMDQRKEVIGILGANGWHIVHSGPYTNKKMWPKTDMRRFKIVAEVVIASDKVTEEKP